MNQIFPHSSPEPRPSADFPTVAMVFAAGLGTRMRPLTDSIPKPLVRVAGKALIDYALDDFAAAGVTEVVVNVHHLADQIESHLSTRKSPRIIISDERSLLLDQGGGIKKVLPIFKGRPFFICNTDAFWKELGAQHLRALARAWDDDKMDAALSLAETKNSVGVDWDGDFDLDFDGRILQPEGSRPYVYSGVGIIKPELFENVTLDVFKLAPFFFAAAKQKRLYGVATRSLWLHVGTVAAIAQAERTMTL